MIPDYYIEKIRNPTYGVIVNGKEHKRLPFLKQAINYARKHNSDLWSIKIEIVDLTTGENIKY